MPDHPTRPEIRLLEGEVSDVDACTVIGDFRVVDLPAGLAAGSPIEIEYGYDRSGHIKVSAREFNEAQLFRVIREAKKNNPKMTALIRGDSESALRYAVRVMGMCNKAEMKYRIAALQAAGR